MYVRFGSLADISQRNRRVRFTPESGHSVVQMECPISQKRTCGLRDAAST